ncbi:MAG: hypothetical protein PHY00_02010 [Bacilli bacterium]|nr:hypothetical protein [Bacilli bacterium]
MNTRKKILSDFFRVIKMIKRNKSIVIVAPYFNEERLKDGYYKRVKAIDELFKDYFKVYVTYETNSNKIEFEDHGSDTVVVRYLPSSKKQKLLISLIMIVCKRIYCHSIWQVRKNFFKLPGVKVYIDMHGVVPEEETLYGRYEDAQMYGDIEEVAVQKAEYLICVTNKIQEHLKSKYGKKYKTKSLILPIYDTSLSKYDSETADKKPLIDGKPIVIYAGGIMKWQKIELMQESIFDNIHQATYMIYCPKPKEFWSTWNYPKHKNLTVGSKNYIDLCNDVYSVAHYGYALRDDITVNHVACPTKIAEYLKYKIIPIVSSPKIGDFSDLGMQYITLKDFNSGRLFSEKEMKLIVENNLLVLKKYIEIHNNGKKDFAKIFK